MLDEPLTMEAEDDATIVGLADKVDISVMEEIDRVSFCDVRDTRRRKIRWRGCVS